jgi:hypothetical protein
MSNWGGGLGAYKLGIRVTSGQRYKRMTDKFQIQAMSLHSYIPLCDKTPFITYYSGLMLVRITS